MERWIYKKGLFGDEGGEPVVGGGEPAPEEGTSPKEGQPEKEAEGKKYTDADVDRLISQKFAEWQKRKERDLEEAGKLAKMNAEEKARYERDTLKKELDELKAKNARAEMATEVRGMLAESGVQVPEALVDVLIGKDAESTKGAVSGFVTNFRDAVQAEVSRRLAGGSPRGGSPAGNLTKEAIMKETDREKRLKLISDNMDLFK